MVSRENDQRRSGDAKALPQHLHYWVITGYLFCAIAPSLALHPRKFLNVLSGKQSPQKLINLSLHSFDAHDTFYFNV